MKVRLKKIQTYFALFILVMNALSLIGALREENKKLKED